MTRVSRWITVAVVSMVIVLLPGCSTARLQNALRNEHRLAGGKAEFFETDGLALHIRTTDAIDDNPDLLLLHGFLSHLQTWELVAGNLTDCCNTVAYDRIGFGLSQRPLPSGKRRWSRDENPYRPVEVQKRAESVLLEYTEAGAVVVGHSAGASLALELALRNPGHIRALVLISPAIYSTGPPALITWFSQTRLGGALVLRQLHKMATEPQPLFQQAWHSPEIVAQQTRDQYMLLLSTENWDRALLEVLRSSERKNNLALRLGEVTLPILIIHGREDSVVPVDESRELAEELVHARLVELDSCGHVPQEEQPAVTEDLIRSFVEHLSQEEF